MPLQLASDPQNDGIRYLGDFFDLEAAKAAVEASVASPDVQHATAQIPDWIF
jgi:predicted outer membrane protein